MSRDENPSAFGLTSLVYSSLVLTSHVRGHGRVGWVWQRAWDRASARWSGPVATRLHGRRVVVNFGYPYPVYLRQYKTYNAPLVEAVNEVVRRRGHSATVVDVGAAVGDTALLLKERCPSLRGVICIDGDSEFLRYLYRNLGDDSDIEIREALLSRQAGSAGSLARTHRGSASAIGPETARAVTLDSVLEQSALAAGGIDVVKVDVDGFDGAVLAGAVRTLEQHGPAVLFEWHPTLYVQAGNDVLEPFQVLTESGYRRFSWFTRTGQPAFEEGYDAASLTQRAQAVRAGSDPEEHWDVLARRDV